MRQAMALSAFLFTLYTLDSRHNTDSCHIEKFLDDKAIIGCMSEEPKEVRGIHRELCRLV